MKTLGNLSRSNQDFERQAAVEQKRPLTAIVVVAGLLLVAIVLAVYFLFIRMPAQSTSSQQQSNAEAPSAASTEAQIFEDEAMLRDSQAIVGGRVRNISRQPLYNLSLELELKRRSTGTMESRMVSIEPKNLAPGEEGRYSLSLPRQEFSETQIKQLRSGARSSLVAFKTSPGAPRPKEPPPQQQTRTIIIERPSTRTKGDEFINTPDTPTKLP